MELQKDEKQYQQEILGSLRVKREEILQLGKEYPRCEGNEEIQLELKKFGELLDEFDTVYAERT